MELLCGGLNDPECTIKKLKLHVEILSESGSRHLADIFRRNHRLIELELSFKSPDDKTMELLCGGLNDPECTIKKLKISGESLSESCSRHLAEVFRGNQSLRHLELTLKNSNEKTMGLLYEGLKHPECKIETLQLHKRILSESCSRHLAEIFKRNQRLRTLSLSLNKPDDQSMLELCKVLKQPQCTIETLWLHVEIELDLSICPDDKTMELLCGGLNDPECTIKKLKLHVEILSESGSRHLADIFRRNHRLIELELSFKSPDDKTMELLCGGLNDPECTIKKLKISGESLSESCSRHLAEIFRGNQSLLELTLKNSNEKTMGLLYEGLKHPECKIETLQ
ncbi:NACHT, LRR and PYD domains-containing protein 12-like [Thamnophis elegans]|uniref:NACHT, LRR and PYD domains-containing protein 12-like n=1 Tax=Thamnophis elegans TaxID=35005 RepID=UPI0013782BCD|nr:NACHT, LRR and PYD domains-containing protein 12-like [Thamnophis elegans]